LFDPRQPDEISQAVEQLLANPDAAAALAAAGRKRSREKHHPAVIAQRHIEIYRELLGNP